MRVLLEQKRVCCEIGVEALRDHFSAIVATDEGYGRIETNTANSALTAEIIFISIWLYDARARVCVCLNSFSQLPFYSC